MESFAWCAVGAAWGWIAGRFASDPTRVTRIEDILVGIAGAFVGAEFLVDMIWGDKHGLGPRGLAMATAGAIVALALLGLMRRAVGPMKTTKTRRRDS